LNGCSTKTLISTHLVASDQGSVGNVHCGHTCLSIILRHNSAIDLRCGFGLRDSGKKAIYRAIATLPRFLLSRKLSKKQSVLPKFSRLSGGALPNQTQNVTTQPD
jgi:hypothetical protein